MIFALCLYVGMVAYKYIRPIYFNQPRRFCLMHSNHLGIYHICNAEGLLILATNKQRRWNCSFDDALQHCFCDFKHWCKRNKICCSQRRWSEKKLNLTDPKGFPSFPSLDGKAFNSRVILAWLADPSFRTSICHCVTCSHNI